MGRVLPRQQKQDSSSPPIAIPTELESRTSEGRRGYTLRSEERIMKVNFTIGIPAWLDRIFAWPAMIYRKQKYGFSFRRIYLGDGIYTVVDAEDYYRFGKFRWGYMGSGDNVYAVRSVRGGRSGFKLLVLHKEIKRPRKGKVIDHKNCNSLDNRKDNLRYATRGQNAGNCKKRRARTSSRYMGVYYSTPRQKWASKIMYRGKERWLGSFKSEFEAARAYDRAALKYRGKYARLNFPHKDFIVPCLPPHIFGLAD
jgi:hypothetical protein